VPSDGTTFLAGERLTGMTINSFESRHRRVALGALTALTALVLGACSSGDDDAAGPITTTTADSTTTTASEDAAGTEGFVLDEELDPGTYQSENFLIPISVTVPAGWEIFEDEPGHFGLDVVAHPEPPVLIIRDVAASALGCVEAADDGVGTSAAVIAETLANRDGIVASEPEPVSIGGLDGVVVDVALDPSWTQGCPFSDGEPTVSTLIGNAGASAEFFWGVMADSSQRIYLLDVDEARGGGNLLVMVETCCGVAPEERIAESTPVVESLRFFDGA
jgi:hypothetical protein